MKVTFHLDYGRVLVLASTKDDQTMIELLSRAIICKENGYGTEATYEPTEEVLRITVIDPTKIIAKVEEE